MAFRFGFGHIADPFGHQVTPVHRLIGAAAPLIPKSVDLSSAVLKGPGIMDQMQSSSCVGHAIVGAIETRLAGLGKAVPHHAPVCAYDAARCIDRLPLPDGTLPPLRDEGSSPNQAHRGLTEWGICPYDDRPTDMTTINAEPNLTELSDAARWRLVGYYGISALGAARTILMQQALAAGYPIPFATFADTGFQEWDPNKGPLGAPNQLDPTGGGHYLYACGYDTSPSGIVVFRFVNSWTTAWGDGGFGEADPSFIGLISDIYVEEAEVLADPDAATKAAA